MHRPQDPDLAAPMAEPSSAPPEASPPSALALPADEELPPGAQAVADAIASRRSVRAFLPTPVDPQVLDRILELSARAPSGSNIQPWHVFVLTGAPLKALGAELVALEQAGGAREPEYQYYPRQWREPYLARRRKTGWGLYAALGIGRGENERMAAQHARNLVFFDAPVGLIFTIDRDMELGSWLDYGMFLENIMVAARGFGLDTCPQAAFVPHAGLIRTRLAIPATQMLVCGMSLGYADPDAPENAFTTEREPLSGFVRRVEALAP